MTQPAPFPVDEHERLAVLRQLLVLDSEPEPVFDSIARLAAEICGTPIAAMTLVDAERQWFKAAVGIHGVTETPRDIAFCAHTILHDEVMNVPDTRQDARFASNPLVTEELAMRTYAGAPLVAGNGLRVGALCVVDQQPRQLDETQLKMLKALADVASDALAMRRDLIEKSLSIRSQYEVALSHSESHYRAIVEDQEEFISLARPDGVLTYVNPAYARLFGTSPGDMVGRSLFDYVTPGDREFVADLLRQVARSGRRSENENRMVAADGVEHWVHWTNGISRDSQGRMLLHSVGRDVSERKRAEEDLRASQSFLSRTGRVAGIGGWEVDLSTNRVNWSDETRRIHEVGPDYVPSVETGIAFYDASARETIASAVQVAIASGRGFDLELPLTTALGRSIWVRTAGSAEYDADGRAVRLVGAFQDVSERKRLERTLASQTATLKLVTESIPATVAVIDHDRRYRFVNRAFELACGLKREQVLGRRACEVLGEAEYQRRRPYVQRALEQGETVRFELAYEGPRHVAFEYVPLKDATGDGDGFVVISQDVTQQKRESLRLLELSQRDPLTGLLNRAGFEQYLERQVLEGGGPSLALLYIDLDGFKGVNDRLGHPVGDKVLQEFSRRVNQLVRPTDAVARLGGDEFAVALSGIRHHAHARLVADKIINAAKTPFEFAGIFANIGASVGVAFNACKDTGWTDLVERADAKLLAAKAAGKGQQHGVASYVPGESGFMDLFN